MSEWLRNITGAQSPSPTSFRKQDAVRPRRIHAQGNSVELTVRISWRTMKSVSMLFFGALLFAFVLYLTLESHSTMKQSSVFFAAPIGMLLYGIICMINNTHIKLTGRELKYWVTPLWIGRGKTIPTSEIVNFANEQRVVGSGSRTNRIERVYRLNVVLKNGQTRRICRTVDRNETLYLEHLLEQFLKLEDRTEFDEIIS